MGVRVGPVASLEAVVNSNGNLQAKEKRTKLRNVKKPCDSEELDDAGTIRADVCSVWRI
jgi:hypothetical protein